MERKCGAEGLGGPDRDPFARQCFLEAGRDMMRQSMIRDEGGVCRKTSLIRQQRRDREDALRRPGLQQRARCQSVRAGNTEMPSERRYAN